jgi:MFS family permease
MKFRGWPIVAVGFAAQFLALGCTIAVYGLFIPVLTDEFGASFLTANLGLSLIGVVMALAGAFIGPLLDRGSIRAVMSIGAALNACAFAAMTAATQLWQLGLLFGVVVALGTAMLGPLAANTVIAKWFGRYRGRAIGIASMGPPTGGFLLSPIVGTLIADYGYQSALLTFVVLHLLIIPVIWMVIRNTPAELGQLPDGEAPSAEFPAAPEGRAWSTAEVLKARNFWVIAIALGMVGAVAGSFNANVIPFANDLGFGLQQASLFISALGGTAIVGTLVFGLLADRIDNRLLLWVAIVLQALPFVYLRFSEPGYLSLLGSVLVFGLAAGSLGPVVASAIGRGFGPVSFGRVMGFIGPVTLPFGFVGPPLVGFLRQQTGSYYAAFELFVGIFVVALLVLIALRLPKQ